MSKIICDICGTVYQDTADSCPICGYAHVSGIAEDLLADSPQGEQGKITLPGEGLSQKKKEIFDYDEVNSEEHEAQQEVYLEDGPEDPEEHRPNILLVILLVTIITLLLTATLFLFLRFYLPNNRTPGPETETVQTLTTDPTEGTTQPEIPCQSLTLTGGVTELNREGQLWLLHVTVFPEDTTDPLVFYSEDENVVTVSENGRLTAIGEGETNVYIVCGAKELRCHVVVRYQEETVAAEETLPADTLPVPDDSTQTTEGALIQESEPATDIVLKLKDTDRSSNKRGVSFDLELDCDLKPEDVTWLTLDSRVAIVRNGTVTTIGPGSTKIIAQYNGQQVECIIRCNF